MSKKVTKKRPFSPNPEPREDALRSLMDLAERADAGDVTAMSLLRQWMKQYPGVITTFGGNLAERAAQSLIGTITGECWISKESILQHLDQMRAELAGPNPSAIEKLLVDRVIACWLQVYHADLMAARADDGSLQTGDYLQRRQDHAHRRFLNAVKLLATVRRLALPIRVDLNVSGGVETKPAKPTHPALPNWDRVPSAN